MMAATKYTYSISGDFPNHKVNTSRLSREIVDSSIATDLLRIDTSGDDCDIWFVDALSTGDETTLDGLVAAHTGDDMPDTDNYVTTRAPTVDDDETWGFGPGSRWLDTSTEIAYICTKSTEGEADWVKDADILGTTELRNEPIAQTPPTTGQVLTWMVDSVGAGEWQSESTPPPGPHATTHEVGGDDLVAHDDLTGYVADEHIDHTGVSVTAGEGMTGGGDLTASRSLAINVDGLPELAEEPADTDYVIVWDADAGVHKKVSYPYFLSNQVGFSHQITIEGDLQLATTTDTLISGLTYTPEAGTYLVFVGGSISNSVKGREMYISIYVGGTKVVTSEVFFEPGEGNYHVPLASVVTRVVVNGAQTVEARWRSEARNPASTMSILNRHITFLKVG